MSAATQGLYANLTVMIIEDEGTQRMAMRRSLEKGLGVQVVESESGKGAFSMFKTRIPDLILLDISLPDIDGDAVLNRIRSDEKLQHIPVLVCTAHRARDMIVRMMDMNISGFIVKPFTSQTICSKVQSVFDKYLKAQTKV